MQINILYKKSYLTGSALSGIVSTEAITASAIKKKN